MKPPGERRRQGRAAEQEARAFLEQQGLRTITCNYHSPRGELDLIMEDSSVIVFVEVRSRSRNDFVPAAETVDRRKQTRILYASRHFLQKKKLTDKVDCRFDVVLITGSSASRKIEWIKNAFEA